MTLTIIDRLLRQPLTLIDTDSHDISTASIGRAVLLTMVVSCAIMGAGLGLFRGGIWIVYSAIKLPFAVLLTAAFCAPVLTAALESTGQRANLRDDVMLLLVTLARASLVVAALAPLIVLSIAWSWAHSTVFLLTLGTGALGAILAVRTLAAGIASRPRTTLRQRRGQHFSGLLLGLALLTVGAQVSWTLRPYLGSAEKTPTFISPGDSSLLDAIDASIDRFTEPYFPDLYHRDRSQGGR